MANYGLAYQARSLAAVHDREERVRFVVGTLNLREENEVHLVREEGGGSNGGRANSAAIAVPPPPSYSSLTPFPSAPFLLQIEYDQETDTIRCEAVFSHKHEIWDLAPCPYDPSLLFTVYNTGEVSRGEGGGGEGRRGSAGGLAA